MLRRDDQTNNAIPATAETTEADKIPNLEALMRLGSKARLAMNNAIVKPILASRPPAARKPQLRVVGRGVHQCDLRAE
jgi:hypothetical protein